MGVKAWITVNGNHIPIMDGESKIQAVGRFIKGKREKSRESVRKGYEAQGYNRKYAEGAELQQRKQLGEYKGNKQFEKQRTIKGRAPSREKLEQEFDELYSNAYYKDRKIKNQDIARRHFMAIDKAASKMQKKYGMDFDKEQRYKLKAEKITLDKLKDKYFNAKEKANTAYNKGATKKAEQYEKLADYYSDLGTKLFGNPNYKSSSVSAGRARNKARQNRRNNH